MADEFPHSLSTIISFCPKCRLTGIFFYLLPSVAIDVHVTDASQSFHLYGNIPDARNVIFGVWRDYEEIRITDVSFYLRLNHSRLVTSKLRWRPEIRSEIMVSNFGNLRIIIAYS